MHANRICRKNKKKAVKSGTISSSEKYGYRINYL